MKLSNDVVNAYRRSRSRDSAQTKDNLDWLLIASLNLNVQLLAIDRVIDVDRYFLCRYFSLLVVPLLCFSGQVISANTRIIKSAVGVPGVLENHSLLIKKTVLICL